MWFRAWPSRSNSFCLSNIMYQISRWYIVIWRKDGTLKKWRKRKITSMSFVQRTNEVFPALFYHSLMIGIIAAIISLKNELVVIITLKIICLLFKYTIATLTYACWNIQSIFPYIKNDAILVITSLKKQARRYCLPFT